MTIGWRRGGPVFKLGEMNWSGLCCLLVGLTGVGSGAGAAMVRERAAETAELAGTLRDWG